VRVLSLKSVSATTTQNVTNWNISLATRTDATFTFARTPDHDTRVGTSAQEQPRNRVVRLF
jgi:hypothetical protein